jgi:hypothetical protein
MKKTHQKNFPLLGVMVGYLHLGWHMLKAKYAQGFPPSSLEMSSFNATFVVEIFRDVN